MKMHKLIHSSAFFSLVLLSIDRGSLSHSPSLSSSFCLCECGRCDFAYLQSAEYDPKRFSMYLNGMCEANVCVSHIHTQTWPIKQSANESIRTLNAIYMSSCVWHTAFYIFSFSLSLSRSFYRRWLCLPLASNLNSAYLRENGFNLLIVSCTFIYSYEIYRESNTVFCL